MKLSKSKKISLLLVLGLLIVLVNLGPTNSQEVISNIPIATTMFNDWYPQLVFDGEDSAIITWYGGGSLGEEDIHAQKLNNSGALPWGEGGVVVSNAPGQQLFPKIIASEYGSVIIVWQDLRDASYRSDIYAQKVDGSGSTQWITNGVPICRKIAHQEWPTLTPDGLGGAIIVWQDSRTFSISGLDIYAQRVDSAGFVKWTEDGIPISTAPMDQKFPEIIPDGSGGAIIIWQDYRNGNWDIYAQRIDSEGVIQWETNGIVVCNDSNDQTLAGTQETPGVYPYKSHLIPDGLGGAIIVWEDKRTGGPDVYAQRINKFGTAEWVTNGVHVSTVEVGAQSCPIIVSDGAGGGTILWSGSKTILAQRINSTGKLQWDPNKLWEVYIQPENTARGFFAAIPENTGGAIVVWEDNRTSNWSIYAQMVNGSGYRQWNMQGISIATTKAGNQTDPIIIRSASDKAIIGWLYRESGTQNYDVYAAVLETGEHVIQPEPTFTFNLKEGSNLITLPYRNITLSTAEGLATHIGSICIEILYWNITLNKFVTYPENNFKLKDGEGYLVKLAEETTFTISGEEISSVEILLKPGWNAIGHFSSDTYPSADILSRSIGENCTAVASWNTELGRYIIHPTVPYGTGLGDFAIEQGKGYFVYITAETSWINR